MAPSGQEKSDAGLAARVAALPGRVNADRALLRRGRFLSTKYHLAIGAEDFLVRIVDGRVTAIERGPLVTPSWVFEIAADAAAWDRFCEARPPPGHHDLFALLRRKELRLAGNLQPLMAHLQYFKEVLARLRRTEGGQ